MFIKLVSFCLIANDIFCEIDSCIKIISYHERIKLRLDFNLLGFMLNI